MAFKTAVFVLAKFYGVEKNYIFYKYGKMFLMSNFLLQDI
jgi:hypothetical protein